MRRLLLAAILTAAPGALLAQSSSSYRLEEQIFNAGGRPADAVVSSSASYRLSLDSIGEGIARRGLSGARIQADGGFLAAYSPPGEVADLDFLPDGQTLAWSWEPASTAYNVYAGALPGLPGGYGGCAIARVAGISWPDPSSPAPGAGRFYLVTGENRLWEEGTKGYASDGLPRANPAPCP